MDDDAPSLLTRSRASTWRVAILFAALLALATLDIASDLAEGVELAHVWIEGAMVVFSLVGLGRELRRHRQRTRELQRRSADLEARLVTAKREATDWQTEAHTLSAGVSLAIDHQLERWLLSPAEKETAQLLLKGLSHREIAEVRDVTEASARQQARAIYKKAGLSGRHDLAAFFLEDLLMRPDATRSARRMG